MRKKVLSSKSNYPLVLFSLFPFSFTHFFLTFCFPIYHDSNNDYSTVVVILIIIIIIIIITTIIIIIIIIIIITTSFNVKVSAGVRA